MISAAHTYGRRNGPGCKDYKKPVYHRTRLNPEKAKQFEQFIEDKQFEAEYQGEDKQCEAEQYKQFEDKQFDVEH